MQPAVGAMIVAPLMTPILGTMRSVVLADQRNLTRSLLLVAGGGLVAIAIGWLSCLVVVNDVIAETNSQVASRVHPRLVDLIAALATGAVGSVALVRCDISDTLPGVAIAISLVPPLSIVGFTFEAGKPDQALGAFLLFLTNVAAILGGGTVVMALYGFHRLVAPAASLERRMATSVTLARDSSREARTLAAARSFDEAVGWTTGNATTRNGVVTVHMEGSPLLPKRHRLRKELEDRGVDPSDVHVELVPARLVTLD